MHSSNRNWACEQTDAARVGHADGGAAIQETVIFDAKTYSFFPSRNIFPHMALAPFENSRGLPRGISA
jgi:hypothetical protein